MATIFADELPFSPRVFDFASNLPTPLNSPSTDYLLSMPQAHIKHIGPAWRILQDSPSHPPLPPDIMVPDPPTPRSNRSGNDTPTPPIDIPGSSEGRRHAEYISGQIRPRVRVNPPDSSIEVPIYSPSSSGGGGLSRPDDPVPSGGHEEQHAAGCSEIDDLTPCTQFVSFPQLDNTSEEGEARARQQPRTSQQPRAIEEPGSKQHHQMPCKKLRKTLRNIPSQLAGLFNKGKVDQHKNDDSTDEHKPVDSGPASYTFGTDFKNSWKSGTRRCRQVRKSVRGIFSSRSSASHHESTESASAIGPAMDPAHDDIENEGMLYRTAIRMAIHNR